MIAILLNIIASSQDPSIRSQAIIGANKTFGIVLLGLIHVLQAKSTTINGQAKWALNQAGERLQADDKKALGAYLLVSPARRATRASVIRAPLDAAVSMRQASQSGKASARSEGAAVANPLHRESTSVWFDSPLSTTSATVALTDGIESRTVSGTLQARREHKNIRNILSAAVPK